MSTKPDELAGKKPAGKGLNAWVQTHKKQAAFGAAALGVIGIALFKKKSAAAATSSSSTQAIDPATGVPYATELADAQSASTTGAGAGYYGASSSGGGYGDPLGTDISQLDSQISALSAQLASSGAASSTPPDLPANLIQPTNGVTPVAPPNGNASGAIPALPQEYITTAGIPVFTGSGDVPGQPNVSLSPGAPSRFQVGPNGQPTLIPGSGG